MFDFKINDNHTINPRQYFSNLISFSYLLYDICPPTIIPSVFSMGSSIDIKMQKMLLLIWSLQAKIGTMDSFKNEVKLP